MASFSYARIRGGFSTVYVSTATLPASAVRRTTNSPLETALTSGTGSNQVDLEFVQQTTLAASGTTTRDLAGSLSDAFGTTLTFVKIKGIYVTAASGNTNNVLVKPNSSNGFLGPFNAATDRVAIPPGGSFMVTAPASGWTVTAGTGDILYFANSGAGTSVTFDLHLIGTSA